MILDTWRGFLATCRGSLLVSVAVLLVVVVVRARFFFLSLHPPVEPEEAPLDVGTALADE